jgi:hypothetical protein
MRYLPTLNEMSVPSIHPINTKVVPKSTESHTESRACINAKPAPNLTRGKGKKNGVIIT